ncbi:hypothetical protein NL108_015015 [Boleophthalmus pectinirostris]|nr:hypothetical protein NL108_015015 [Boleophthalmus pectinirostris]
MINVSLPPPPPPSATAAAAIGHRRQPPAAATAARRRAAKRSVKVKKNSATAILSLSTKWPPLFPKSSASVCGRVQHPPSPWAGPAPPLPMGGSSTPPPHGRVQDEVCGQYQFNVP